MEYCKWNKTFRIIWVAWKRWMGSDYHWYSSPVIDGVLRQPFGPSYHDHSCTMLWCVLGITWSNLDTYGPPASTQRKQRNYWTNFWRSKQISSNQHKRMHQGAKSDVFRKYRWSPVIDSLLYCQLLDQNSGGTTLSSAPELWPCRHILLTELSVSYQCVLTSGFSSQRITLANTSRKTMFFSVKKSFYACQACAE